MSKNQIITIVIAVLAGVMLAPRLRQLPGVNKLPTV